MNLSSVLSNSNHSSSSAVVLPHPASDLFSPHELIRSASNRSSHSQLASCQYVDQFVQPAIRNIEEWASEGKMSTRNVTCSFVRTDPT